MHAPILSVRGGHEVGIVESTSILSICNDSVASFTTFLKVVLLEVAGGLGEAITVRRSIKNDWYMKWFTCR